MRQLDPTPRNSMTGDEIAEQTTRLFESLRARFESSGQPVDFDFREHCLQWTSRGDHYTHRLHRYPARLTPYIPLFIQAVRSLAPTGGRLLDPFAGCGTVLVEAPVHPAHPMCPVGFEINPLARLIAKVKTTPLDEEAVNSALEVVHQRYRSDRSRVGLPRFPNKRHWFSRAVEERIARLLRAFDAIPALDIKDFAVAILSSIIREISTADPSVSVPVRLNPSRYRKASERRRIKAALAFSENADVWEIFHSAAQASLNRLTSWMAAKPTLGAEPTVCGTDARTFQLSRYLSMGQMTSARDETIQSVDLVLTSPPYANAQRYTRSLRLELFVLGFTADSASERKLDVDQVGTERVPEKAWDELAGKTRSKTANDAIVQIARTDRYRAAIVGRYVRDMEQVIENCNKALNNVGHAVFVVGNNCIRGVELDNALIFRELAASIGMQAILHVRNRIPSRGLLTKRHPTAGVITHEHVLVFKKSQMSEPLSTGRRGAHVSC
jgi:hypothetical protein